MWTAMHPIFGLYHHFLLIIPLSKHYLLQQLVFPEFEPVFLEPVVAQQLRPQRPQPHFVELLQD
jgi:hypothetical protein